MLKTTVPLQVRSTVNDLAGSPSARAGTSLDRNMLSISAPLEPIVKRFGQRLRHLRQRHGYTQAELAKFLGMDRSYLSDVECGKKAMSLGYLDTVAHGFNISLADLVAGL